jgi:hypothetical protein
MLHVIGERFDLLCPGTGAGGSLLQTPHELEPSGGKWTEAVLVGHYASNFGESQGLSRPPSQYKHLRNRKQVTGVILQGPPGVALVREMRQEGKASFQHGAFAITRHCNGTIKQLIKHGRTSGKKGRRNILP